MKKNLRTIAIIGLPSDGRLSLHQVLFDWLNQQGFRVLVENKLANQLRCKGADLTEISKNTDMAIVIGGDGNMLFYARLFAKSGVPLIGINRGNLGFLAEIPPVTMIEQLQTCLVEQQFFIEERFLLTACVEKQGVKIAENIALNEILVVGKKPAQLIEFAVFINDEFAFSQRADGLLVATPTGSTAYSLSAGGPILTPDVNAMILSAIMPHALSSRPLILDANSKITLQFTNGQNVSVVFDSHNEIDCDRESIVTIKKYQYQLQLLHLKGYDYFNALRSKLGWFK